GKINIQSFDWRVLESVKIQAPYIKTAALLGQSTFKSINDSVPSPWLNGIHFEQVGGTSLAILEEAKQYINIFSPSWRLIDPTDNEFLGSSVKEIQSAGFKVIPWTINTTQIMKKLIDEGVDGIITDYPDSLKFVLEKFNIPQK
ncbi:MAG: glycerophosphodiester phosphodiesterase family protein, partial [bacterium]